MIKMTIALDFDGTVTNDPDTWLEVIKQFQKAGHLVYIVTMRTRAEIDGGHNFTPIPKNIQETVNGIYATSRQAKEPFMKSMGIDITVWIDDNPKAVSLSANQIWG